MGNTFFRYGIEAINKNIRCRVEVEVIASNENEAIEKAKKLVARDYYNTRSVFELYSGGIVKGGVMGGRGAGGA